MGAGKVGASGWNQTALRFAPTPPRVSRMPVPCAQCTRATGGKTDMGTKIDGACSLQGAGSGTIIRRLGWFRAVRARCVSNAGEPCEYHAGQLRPGFALFQDSDRVEFGLSSPTMTSSVVQRRDSVPSAPTSRIGSLRQKPGETVFAEITLRPGVYSGHGMSMYVDVGKNALEMQKKMIIIVSK